MPKILKRDPLILGAVIERCCRIKADVVGRDERESGVRAILNFGHTIGHALEAISGYGRYLHGEAISIGQVMAATLSQRLRGLPARDVERIQKLFERAGLPTHVDLTGSQRQRVLEAMRLDKKVRGGEVQFVLASRIGKVGWGEPVPEKIIHQVLSGS